METMHLYEYLFEMVAWEQLPRTKQCWKINFSVCDTEPFTGGALYNMEASESNIYRIEILFRELMDDGYENIDAVSGLLTAHAKQLKIVYVRPLTFILTICFVASFMF